MADGFRFAALMLMGAALVVFPLQTFLPVKSLILVSADVLGRPWTIFTHMFLHGSPRHLLGNMFALGLFGSILERLVGWRRFLLVFLLGGAVSSLGDVLFYASTIGASGAVFGIIGAVAVLRPRMPVPALGTILPMAIAAGGWILLDLTGVLYPDGIAHAAHLFGAAAGAGMGFWLRRQLPEEQKPSKEGIREDKHRKWEEYWMKRPYPEERPTHFR